MNIAGMDKAEVLAALYNGARQQGLGLFDQKGKKLMTVEEARAELAEVAKNGERPYFDYWNGRVMKIHIADELETHLYNRDNGDGAAERIIESLRTTP